jgi:hypothetical protein
MANEITLNFKIQAKNGEFSFLKNVSNRKFDQTTQGSNGPGTHDATTSETSVTMAGNGLVTLENLDDTNFVLVGFATTVYPLKLGPRDVAFFRLNGTQTLYFDADSDTCKVQIDGLIE